MSYLADWARTSSMGDIPRLADLRQAHRVTEFHPVTQPASRQERIPRLDCLGSSAGEAPKKGPDEIDHLHEDADRRCKLMATCIVPHRRAVASATTYIGASRRPLGLMSTAIHHWLRARDIRTDIVRHTGVRVPDLATYASYGAPVLGMVVAGVFAVVVHRIPVTVGNTPLAMLLLTAAIVAMIAIAAKPWRDAAQALLDHFQAETGTRVADPDAGLTDVRVEFERVDDWELWHRYPVKRVEFVRGGAPFPAGSWAVFSLLTPRGRLNHLQDVLNRHWAFHQRPRPTSLQEPPKKAPNRNDR